MFGWGDDNRSAMIESSAVLLPWLIWIQLLVFFFLLLLLSTFFGLHLFASPHSPASTTTASSGVAAGHVYSSSSSVSSCHHRRSLQGEGDRNIAGQQMITNTRNGTSGTAVNLTERDSSLTYSLEDSRSLKHPNHPCHYLELATRAFLGCLGLSSAPRNHSPQDTEEDAND